MATYTIKIVNNSGAPKSYVIFIQAPSVSARNARPEVHETAWVTFSNIPNGGSDSAVYSGEAYAYWGPRPEGVEPRIQTVGGTAAVTIATHDSLPFFEAAIPAFGRVESPGRAMHGRFQIITGSGFKPDDGYVLGLARRGAQPWPTPVVTFAALPGETYDISPSDTFYVAEGAYAPGQLLPRNIDSTRIDFRDAPSRATATASQDAAGAWTITYA